MLGEVDGWVVSVVGSSLGLMDLRRHLHWIAWMRVVFRLSYRKDCIGIRKGIILHASHVVAYPVFHSTRLHLAFLGRCAYLLY